MNGRRLHDTRSALVLGLLTWLFSFSALAQAPETGDAIRPTETFMAEVWVVLGSTEGDSVDPALKVLPALSKPPFDSFPRKKLLSMSKIVLQQDKPAELDLPNGRKMRLLWLGRGSEGRLRIEVSINRPGKRDYLPVMTVAAAPGDPFFVAGQQHQGGTLILGVRVGVPPTRAPKPTAKP